MATKEPSASPKHAQEKQERQQARRSASPPVTAEADKPQSPQVDEHGDEGEGDEGEARGNEAGEQSGQDEESGEGEEEGEERNSDKENEESQGAGPGGGQPQPHAWQAVWAPQQGAYYFWNAKTGETTWTNPLAPSPSAATTAAAGPSSSGATTAATAATAAPSTAMSDEDFAAMHGIDPDLAFLDPQLYAARLASAKGGGSAASAAAYGASGAFDTRTGKFVPSAAVLSGVHDPSRLSQVARSTRQMEVFFDVNAYQAERAKEREEREAGGDAKRQRLNKKELKAFKEKRKEKRLKKWKED